MIITLTANPSVDRTLFVAELPRGGIIRSERSRSEPSGKGVNVTLALARHGYATRAVFPAGGYAGLQLTQMLQEAGIDHVAVAVKGDVRSNVSLVEPSGLVTKVNESGPVLTPEESDTFAQVACDQLRHATWLAGCGSLPTGVPATLYARLIDACHGNGVKMAIDAWGTPLSYALPHGPDLIAPNVAELAHAVGRHIRVLGDVVEAAHLLREQGAHAVLASLGPDGAMLVDETGACHGEAPVDVVVSAVGAGDALLAGFLSAGGCGREALTVALRWAAAAVQNEGTLSSFDGATHAFIHDGIDLTRRLLDPPDTPTTSSATPPRLPSGTSSHRKETSCNALPTSKR